MLKVENVSYKVKDKFLIDAISMEFEEGKISLIVGPNGAGKSTLLKVLSGQLSNFSGKVFYASQELSKIKLNDLAKMRSLLSQNVDIAFPLTVSEVVLTGRYPHMLNKPSNVDYQICEETMRLFDVWDLADRNYLTLSGGEKQRVHFARVIAQLTDQNNENLKYLILDEPLNSLDIYYQFDFMKRLCKLVKERRMVVVGVLHDLNLVAKYADVVLLLKNGKSVASGDKQTVLTEKNIKDVFLLDVTIKTEADTIHINY